MTNDKEICPDCKGEGIIWKPYSGRYVYINKCEKCKGNGFIDWIDYIKNYEKNNER